MDVRRVVVAVPGRERPALELRQRPHELGVHSLESFLAGIHERGLPVLVDGGDDEVLEVHVEERDIERQRATRPARLQADLAGTRALRLQNARALDLEDVRRGGLEVAFRRDVDIQGVQDGRLWLVDEPQERRDAAGPSAVLNALNVYVSAKS